MERTDARPLHQREVCQTSGWRNRSRRLRPSREQLDCQSRDGFGSGARFAYPTGILFDGQSSITRRSHRPPRSLFVGMAPGRDLTVLGQPLRGEFVAVASLKINNPLVWAEKWERPWE